MSAKDCLLRFAERFLKLDFRVQREILEILTKNIHDKLDLEGGKIDDQTWVYLHDVWEFLQQIKIQIPYRRD